MSLSEHILYLAIFIQFLYTDIYLYINFTFILAVAKNLLDKQYFRTNDTEKTSQMEDLNLSTYVITPGLSKFSSVNDKFHNKHIYEYKFVFEC